MQIHTQNQWQEHLCAHWDHMHNTHITCKTIHGLCNRAHPPTLNTSITFNNTQTYCELFHQPIHKHATHKTLLLLLLVRLITQISQIAE